MPQSSGFLRGYLSGFLGQTVRASDERVIGSLICLEFDSQRCAKSKGGGGVILGEKLSVEGRFSVLLRQTLNNAVVHRGDV